MNKSNNRFYYESLKPFADARRTLEDIERFERRDEKSHELDGATTESRREALRRRRRERREALLGVLVPTRRCPLCGELKLKSKQWVIDPTGEVAVCVGCHRTRKGARGQ